MRKRLCVILVSFALLLVSCQPSSTSAVVMPTATPLQVTSPAYKVAVAFLDAWAQADYKVMYGLCSKETRASVSYDEFLRIYQEVVQETTALTVRPALSSVLEEGLQANAAFVVEVETSFVGTFEAENELPLVWDGDRWAVAWSKRCIFRQLEEENLVNMDSLSPVRANVYDVNGKGLAVKGDLVTVGIVPGQLEDESATLARLSSVLGISQGEIKAKYEDQPPTWFIPIADLSVEKSRQHYEVLSKEPGVSLREKSVRVYPAPVTAPHIIGFMSKIPAEETKAWQDLGYVGDELIGRVGIEAWGESYLAGQRGGTLTVITPGGQVVANLAHRDAVPARSVYLTIDYDYQLQVEELLGERKGAVVVMDVDDGRILAMATWPRFDPNVFAEGIDPKAWSALVNDPANPLMNRAMQGQYPPGSIFKIVTMGTLMERGGVEPAQTYQCAGTWNELGWPMTCWLKTGHGAIDIVTALTASCDVAFYQIGYDLSFIDKDALPSYARSFGLGAPTGLGMREEGNWQALGEAAGLVPDDTWKRKVYDEGWATGDNVNLAIGQGFLLTTPLQMARLIAAVANGGTLYQPQIVSKVSSAGGLEELTFGPKQVGRLPITPETLASIQEGLEGVTTSPRGTATHRFVDFPYAVAGKTGTAQNEGELPHAWFIGYLPVDKPEIAIVAMLENVGEGSTFAAPLFRQVAAAYYGVEQEVPEVEGQGD